jgi:hypothetical protein
MSKSIQPPVEIQAQRLEVTELQTRITQVEDQIKALTLEHGRIRLGGHDIHQRGLPIEFLRKVMRDYPTAETTKLADAFELERLAPLRQELAALKQRLSHEQVVFGQLKAEFVVDNAAVLLAQAVDRLADAGVKLNDAKAHHASLEQRLASARMAVLENERLQAAHDGAVAQALADGKELPAKPEVQFVDDVKALQTALSLSRDKVKALGDEWSQIDGEVRNLRGVISSRKLTEFMTSIKAQAASAGVRIESVRDELIRLTGPSLMHQMDSDELHRLRHELSTLRPEVDKLRQDNRVLQDGIQQLTTRRYG